jgi:hypothetical protein
VIRWKRRTRRAWRTLRLAGVLAADTGLLQPCSRPNTFTTIDGLDFVAPSDFTFARRTWVHACPTTVYDLISDVPMIATWSPNASDVAFDDGAGPHCRSMVQRPQQQGRQGTEVRQEWRILRTDPVLGDTRADVETLRDYLITSVEPTLVSLARWISENPPSGNR